MGYTPTNSLRQTTDLSSMLNALLAILICSAPSGSNQGISMIFYTNHRMLNPFVCLLLFIPFLTAYEDPRYRHCGSTTSFKYTANSTFASNLSKAFNILKNNTSATNFNSTTYTDDGREPVTALALCRGDLKPEECRPCVEAATTGIVDECPHHSSAEIWYNLCMMRYSGENFLTRADYTPLMVIWDTREVQEPDIYNKKVQQLAQNLSISAGKSEKRFAVGWTRVSNTSRLHGYQACSRDLNSESCTNCLRIATGTIESCCLGKWAGWIATASCEIRFNTDPVYNESNIFAPEILTDDVASGAPPSLPAFVMNDKSDKIDWKLIVGVPVGVIMGLIFVAGSLWYRVMKGKKRNKMQRRVSRGDGDDQEDEKVTDSVIIDAIGSGSFLFEFEMLANANENFSLTNRLGRGGFGTVYKGVMSNGTEIAVKKLTVGSNQGAEEFSNEVMVLLRMQHRNLVQLLGCCIQEDKMLVYEYLPNKSLDRLIFDKSKSALLDWPKRLKIIVGVARGLLYLHEDSQLRIIHRDIKASNILLDDQMNPKISDFGLVRLFPDELSQLRTRRIAGTIGYMAPEYAIRGVLSEKSDVFSFGILLLEIVCGRKNFDFHLEEQNRQLLNLTWRLEEEGRLMELVDTTIGSFPQAEVMRCLRIGLLCCQEIIQDRPAMSSIILMLSNDSVRTPFPGLPAYRRSSSNTSSIVRNSSSNNSAMTVTTLTGR